MSKKFTIEEVKNYIESFEGYKLISKEYKNAHAKLEIQCYNNHIFKKSYSAFKIGERCGECANNKKLTYEYVKEKIESFEGYKLLSDKYINSKEKLTVRCPNGHIYNTSYDNFYHLSCRCSKCAGVKKLTFEEVKIEIEKLDYELISKDFKKTGSFISIRDKFGFYYYTNIDNIIYGDHNPLKFYKSNIYTIQNIKLWLKINNKNFELISDTYEGIYKKLKWKCLKDNCSEIFEMCWNDIHTDKCCPYCAGKRAGLSNCLATKNPELSSEWHPTLNGELTPYKVTRGSHKKVWWICKECGHVWKSTISDRNGGTNCPSCFKSKGENKIKEFLELYNIFFEREYTFVNLVSDLGNQLRFDFAIFKDNEKTKLKYLIEYDGEFHFKKYFKEQNFEILQYHDKLKNEYCKNNYIKLLRIPYWDLDNISQILINELMKKAS